VDSEGQFTLNPQRVKDLLRQFQLPEPAHYALHLVSFLIGAGARAIGVDSAKQHMSLRGEGAFLDESLARAPLAALLSSREANPYLVELALGLNALMGVEGGEARLACGGWEATYTAASIDIKERDPANDGLTIVAKPRFMERSNELEISLIREAFGWCQLPITLNGTAMVRSLDQTLNSGLEIHLDNPRYPLGLSQNESSRLNRSVQAEFSALIRIGRQPPGFRVVYLGRRYEKPLPWCFDVPGWQVDITVSSDRFKKDLSQQALLENAQYQNLLRALRVQMELGSLALLDAVPPTEAAEDLVDDLVEHLFCNGQRDHALRYQNELAHHYSSQRDSLPKGKALYRLTLMEKAVGQSPTGASGTAILCAQTRQPEGRWCRLGAELAFANYAPALHSEVRTTLAARSAPPWLLERCCRWLIKTMDQDPDSRVWYRVDLARLVFQGGRLAEALAHLEQAEAEGYGHSDAEILAVELRAEIAAERGQLAESLTMFERHLTALRDQHGQHSLKLGLTLVRMAKLLDHLGEPKQAERFREWSRNLHQDS
jgi:tetratricopeptide (TPR) repeat protein